MWAAEGIVSDEDVGKGYLDELIERCMVQVGRTSSNGRVQTCQMHDLMRDLCLSKAKEENFVVIIGGTFQQVEASSSSMVTICSRTVERVRRRAIYLDRHAAEARAVSNSSKNEDGDDIYVKYLNPENDTVPLRSLLMFDGPKVRIETVQSMVRKLEWKKFTLLRVLSLEKLSLGDKLPRAIGNLVHLKFLSLKHAKLSRLPWYIRNLGCIQTLDLRFSYFGSEETMSCLRWRMNELIGRMKWLRHLYLPCHHYLGKSSKMQQYWEKLIHLETLKKFDAEQWNIKDLAHLTKLRKLRVDNVEGLKELLEVILKPSHDRPPISLCNSNSNSNNNITSNNNLRSLAVYGIGSKVEETDVRKISKCQHLYKLCLDGEISNLPVHNLFPPNLTKLKLLSCKLKQDPTPILERFCNLAILFLEDNFYTGEEMVFSSNGFPRLKSLRLASRFVIRLRVDKGAMPNLISLSFFKCQSLEMVPEGLRYITTLQTLEICAMHEDFKRRVQVINGKEGGDFYKVRHVPSISIYK